MKKKILLIANEGQRGGAANALLSLAEGLKDEYEPIILFGKSGPLSRLCEEKGINFKIVKFLPFRTVAGPSKLKKYVKIGLFPVLFLRYFLTNHIALKKIEKIIDMNKVSLIHTNTNRDDFGAMLAKKYGIPHVWHIREIDNMPYKCYSFRPRRFDYINRNATKLIMISKFVAEAYIEKGLDAKRMQIIYDGIKIRSNFHKTYSDNGLKIIILGAITEGKNQMLAIEALKMLPNAISKKINLDIYGEGNEYAEMIRQKVKEYRLPRVSVNSFNEDIGSIIPRYDLGLSCAVAEGFGISTVEFMTNKLVTVVTNTGASPEIVTNDSGFVYKLNDAKQLSDIIVNIYDMNEKNKAEWGEKAYQRSKKFSDKKYVEEVKKVYSELIGRENVADEV